jgi:hypothetical protein
MSGEPAEYTDRPVPHYVITGGRAHPTRNTLRPETLLSVDPAALAPLSATPEQKALLQMCQRLLSLAEAAAHLHLPISVVRVLASTLVDSGLLTIRSAARHVPPDRALMTKVLDGLRNL